jgi:hypothetical protein
MPPPEQSDVPNRAWLGFGSGTFDESKSGHLESASNRPDFENQLSLSKQYDGLDSLVRLRTKESLKVTLSLGRGGGEGEIAPGGIGVCFCFVLFRIYSHLCCPCSAGLDMV